MEVHVPHDVILNHILTRVPHKTVGRFKCVSKGWHSLLNDYTNNPKLLVLSKTETLFEFTTIDCEAPLSDKDLTPTRRPLPAFEGITPRNICILASYHGLVCLGIQEMDLSVYSHIILWNPLTSEYKRLSKSNSHMECNNIQYLSTFGLYYSSCEDDYKLLFVNNFYNVYIYSLKSDSWRNVDVPQHTSVIGYWSGGTFLNENLYFLEQHSNGRLSSIIRFDTKTERWLSNIKTPYVFGYTNRWPWCNFFPTIMVISDCVHVCFKYDIFKTSCDSRCEWTETCIKLWKLDEYGNLKEVAYYQLRQNDYNNICSYLIPFHLMKNGNWLMGKNDYKRIILNDRCYKPGIYKVDLKNRKHIKDKGKEEGNIYDDFEYAEVRVDDMNNNIVDVEGSYIETFVSPNRYK